MGWAGNFWTACDRWITAENLWARMTRTLRAEAHITVRYEELIHDPIAELTRICRLCRTVYHPDMLNYPKKSTYAPLDTSNVRSWTRKLSARDIQLVEARVGPMLVERGYELSGLPRLAVSPRLEKRLRRRDYWARLRFRLKRYGVGLLFQRYLARRLHIRAWHKNVQRRIDAIDNAHLK
jgi:hypothetical protein